MKDCQFEALAPEISWPRDRAIGFQPLCFSFGREILQ